MKIYVPYMYLFDDIGPKGLVRKNSLSPSEELPQQGGCIRCGHVNQTQQQLQPLLALGVEVLIKELLVPPATVPQLLHGIQVADPLDGREDKQARDATRCICTYPSHHMPCSHSRVVRVTYMY